MRQSVALVGLLMVIVGAVGSYSASFPTKTLICSIACVTEYSYQEGLQTFMGALAFFGILVIIWGAIVSKPKTQEIHKQISANE